MEALDLILGLLVPVLVELMTKRHWSDGSKTLISVVVSLIVGVSTVWLLGYKLNSAPSAETIVAILVATQASYYKLWKPLFDKMRAGQAIREAVKEEEAVNESET